MSKLNFILFFSGRTRGKGVDILRRENMREVSRGPRPGREENLGETRGPRQVLQRRRR